MGLGIEGGRREDRKEARRQVREWNARHQQYWTIETVKAAIQDFLVGRAQPITTLARSMMLDEAYRAELDKRVNSLVRSEVSFEVSNPSMPGAEELTKDVAAHWETMCPESELKKLCAWYQNLGLAIATYDWYFVDGKFCPVLRALNPEFLRWNMLTCSWQFQTRDDGLVDVDTESGEFFFVNTWSQDLPVGAVTALAETWTYKRVMLPNWADWANDGGHPLLVAQCPADVTPDAKAEFVADVQAAKQAAMTVVLPIDADGKGWSMEKLEGVSADAYAGMQQLVDRADRKFQMYFEGASGTAEMNGVGSYAAAETHKGISLELVEGDAQVLSTAFHDQLLRLFVAKNYGPGTQVPWPRWHVQDQDPAVRFQNITSFLDAVTKAQSAGIVVDPASVQIDFAELGQELGIPFKQVGPST